MDILQSECRQGTEARAMAGSWITAIAQADVRSRSSCQKPASFLTRKKLLSDRPRCRAGGTASLCVSPGSL